MGTHKNRKTKPGVRAAAVVAGCLCQTATTITGNLKKRTKAKPEAAANAPNEPGAATTKQRSHSVQVDPLSFHKRSLLPSHLIAAAILCGHFSTASQRFNGAKQYLEIDETSRIRTKSAAIS